MSTRFTLDHGEGFHLFVDLFESGKVYLSLDGTEFEARPRSVTVAISLDLWDRLRAVDIDRDIWWDEDKADDRDGASIDPGASSTNDTKR
jgi:hypothetical protein